MRRRILLLAGNLTQPAQVGSKPSQRANAEIADQLDGVATMANAARMRLEAEDDNPDSSGAAS
jgi:hypothetical protein